VVKKPIPSRALFVVILVILLLLSSAIAWAAPGGSSDNSIETKPYTGDYSEPKSPEKTELPSMGWYLLKMIVSLAVISGLAYVTLRLVPRKLSPLSGGDFISVYDQYFLGPNKGIYIAEIGGRIVALGVTDHNITVISEILDADLIKEMRENHLTRKSIPGWGGTGIKTLRSLLTNGSQAKQLPFSSHIRQQITKLQEIAQGKEHQGNGKDDTLD
jgi:flagellar protein FliO/FliZ